jgi:hypothetical protein
MKERPLLVISHIKDHVESSESQMDLWRNTLTSALLCCLGTTRATEFMQFVKSLNNLRTSWNMAPGPRGQLQDVVEQALKSLNSTVLTPGRRVHVHSRLRWVLLFCFKTICEPPLSPRLMTSGCANVCGRCRAISPVCCDA